LIVPQWHVECRTCNQPTTYNGPSELADPVQKAFRFQRCSFVSSCLRVSDSSSTAALERTSTTLVVSMRSILLRSKARSRAGNRPGSGSNSFSKHMHDTKPGQSCTEPIMYLAQIGKRWTAVNIFLDFGSSFVWFERQDKRIHRHVCCFCRNPEFFPDDFDLILSGGR
jgi:hypothetical protein